MFERKIYDQEWGGRKLIIETGCLAPLTNGSVKVQYGDTVVLATAVISKNERAGIDYFPLMVDYKENLYAAGKISGSRFMKREGRPTDEAILTGRLVDRSLRPLFDENLRRDVQVVLNVFSLDENNDPDVPSLIAASAALMISDIPWNGPLAGASVALVEDKLILNPTYAEKEAALFEILVANTGKEIVMIEAEGKEAKEDQTFAAVKFALENTQPVIDLLLKIQAELGKTKQAIPETVLSPEALALQEKVNAYCQEHINELFGITDKNLRQNTEAAFQEALKKLIPEGQEDLAGIVTKTFNKAYTKAFRDLALVGGKRVDNRAFDEIRPLGAEIDLLPRTHGSALFQRGETQVLSVVTLGAPGMEQVMDQMEISGTKRYMHHYNFLAFSVGEVSPLRSPGRREIGHGALAEKALEKMIPEKEVFPYTVRVVSEVLASNGSSSQASICGSTLSLMAAGVPIKAPVAGIAIGLVTSEDKSTHRILTDIQGIEDHEGDMDFKIAGTKDGITAIQLDIKLGGISLQVVEEALAAGLKARLQILDLIHGVIAEPRKELSPLAPRIEKMQIDPDKIREVIGPGGKVINEIIAATGAAIDIEDDGTIYITSADAEKLKETIEWIKGIVKEVTVGEIYEGPITQIIKDRNNPNKEIGAIVELTKNQDGMIHISEVAPERINKVSDVLKVGDIVKVKVMGVDKEKGRIELSRKVLLPASDRNNQFKNNAPQPIPYKKQY